MTRDLVRLTSLLIKRYSIRPKKRLGQHFIISASVLDKIVKAIEPGPDETLIEIGAGLGYLTRALAAQAKRVVALEVDPDLIGPLEEMLQGATNAEVVCADALTFELAGIVGKVKIVGNIPYNISAPLLGKILENRSLADSAVLLLQKEFAERIASPPGSKQYGALSVAVQFYCSAEKLFSVPDKAFFPRPGVESQLVRLKILSEPSVGVGDENYFLEVSRACFAQRRKMLKNSLSGQTDRLGLTLYGLERAIEASGIDGRRRAETLSLEEFARLTNLLLDMKRRTA